MSPHDAYKVPEGKLCQAKDEWGLVETGPKSARWGVISHGCDHPASVMWTEGAMAMVHGVYSWWCECHALDEQIRHAGERIKVLDGLRFKRGEACK